MKGPCPSHSKPRSPANHSWEECNFIKEFSWRGNQGPPGSGGGAGKGNGNQNFGHQGASTAAQHQGPGGGGKQNYSGSAGFQANPKQLQDHAAYHVFTTSI